MTKFNVGDRVRYVSGCNMGEYRTIAKWTFGWPQACNQYQFTNGCYADNMDLELVTPTVNHNATKQPRTWGELTEQEQNTIAGHYARGGEVQHKYPKSLDWAVKMSREYFNTSAYRIKPEPVVDEVACTIYIRGEKHLASIQTTDGKPDWPTLKVQTN